MWLSRRLASLFRYLDPLSSLYQIITSIPGTIRCTVDMHLCKADLRMYGVSCRPKGPTTMNSHLPTSARDKGIIPCACYSFQSGLGRSSATASSHTYHFMSTRATLALLAPYTASSLHTRPWQSRESRRSGGIHTDISASSSRAKARRY